MSPGACYASGVGAADAAHGGGGGDLVAEGVERADEATFLRSIGCEYAQGFLFSRPLTEKAAAELLGAT